jgi:hypothetical protein
VTVPKIGLQVAVVVLRWRKLVYDVTSQKTCDVVYSTTRLHDVTSRACDVTYSTTRPHVAIHRRHVTYCNVPDVMSHHRICDVMRSNATTWRHLLEDKTPCILPDMTLHHGTCDMCCTSDYMTSLYSGHVTPCILLHVTSHRRTCDIMCSTPDYMTSLHRGHDVTSDRTVSFTVNAFLTSNLYFRSFLYVLVLNLICFVMLIMFAMQSRKLIPCTYNTHE